MISVKKIAKRLFFVQVSFMVFIVALLSVLLIYVNHPEYFIRNSKGWEPKDITKEIAYHQTNELVNYGYELVTNTNKFLGPSKESAKHYTGNNLTCTNCHLDAGTRAGAASWIGVVNRFPQFSGRSNTVTTIEDRINGCMERSMNGKRLPKESKEMKAIVSYMNWISEGIPKNKEVYYKGFTKIEIPKRGVKLDKGAQLYAKKCAVCHGKNGEGLHKDGNSYQFPPLWGEDTFNDGAGMHRVLTASQFLKANMPYGQATKETPVLSDKEAYDIAGYINSFKRPEKINKQNDFPDRKLKPVSTPYGPWEDSFSEEQHQYGPFLPIISYYKTKYHINKTK